jgi:uncharacterized protein (DUF433 family)/DNA-binding transcriptional MerR regulator
MPPSEAKYRRISLQGAVRSGYDCRVETAMDNLNLLGVGLYSIPQAAQLAKVPSKSVRRWLFGYRYHNKGSNVSKPPVFESESIELPDHHRVVTFRDLIEVQFVHSFREHGVSWDTIRKAAAAARELTRADHPFASHGFVTDGETIFAEVMSSLRRKELLDLKSNQLAFRRMLLPSLRARIDVGTAGAQRWWPLGKNRPIVIDPARQFGQPISHDEGVPTSVLADAYATTGSYRKAASWYEVSIAAVRNAVGFERQFAKAA